MDSEEFFDLNKTTCKRRALVELDTMQSSAHACILPWLVALGMRVTDLALLTVAFLVSNVTWHIRPAAEEGPIIVGGIGAVAMICFCLERTGTYRLNKQPTPRQQVRLRGAAVIAGLAVFTSCLSLLHALAGCLPWLGIWAFLTFAILSVAGGLWARVIAAWRASGALDKRIVVVGEDTLARAFIEHIAAHPGCGLRVIGLYTDVEANGQPKPRPSVNLSDLLARLRSDPLDAVVLTVPLKDPDRLDRLHHALRDVAVDIYALPDLGPLHYGYDGWNDLGRWPMICLARRPLNEWQQFQKTVFDWLIGVLLLVVLFPALVLIALAIRLETSGPVLFRQPRVGFNNRMFTIYKFRTMFDSHDPADISGARQARREDPRITRVGEWLRKLSLDELPQLFNVLKGDMSLVGPRPHPPETRAADRLFPDVVDNYSMRHRVRPGITGWAQVSGWRGETITVHQIEQRVAHDLYYIENWSIFLDLRILFLTVINEIRSKAAF